MTEHASLHRDFADQFSDYYDGELGAEARAAMDEHLATCEACRAEYASFKASLDGLHELGFNFAPNDFVQQVTTTIHRQSRGAFFRESWLFGFRIPYEAFVALLLALIAALYVFGPSTPEPLEVRDLDTTRPQPPEHDELVGQGLGPASAQVRLELPPSADLGVLARALRADGFRPRPELGDGSELLVVSVPPGQIARFTQRLGALVEADTTALLRIAAEGGGRSVDVRLVRPLEGAP